MQHLVLVMLGGALGSGARFGIGRLTLAQFGPGFPWGTLAVNLIGGLAMGLLVGLLARTAQPDQSYFLFLGTGVLGGFTTFSAFSLDAVTLIQRGATGPAAAYVLVSVIGSIAALLAGLAATRGIA